MLLVLPPTLVYIPYPQGPNRKHEPRLGELVLGSSGTGDVKGPGLGPCQGHLSDRLSCPDSSGRIVTAGGPVRVDLTRPRNRPQEHQCSRTWAESSRIRKDRTCLLCLFVVVVTRGPLLLYLTHIWRSTGVRESCCDTSSCKTCGRWPVTSCVAAAVG